ncbi:transmembrane protein 67 [Trypanosoma grayi]|uniref:transmembrane protein 67 n=1 Tax=Trypanosoma grayi TaxID=71804 RepID=UPI0004F4BA5F|nr:transmembrane protein 67 [Trypanosoma grayi]KEG08082.1 transmembrane protein 67 [Trypanosoma grayi]
MAASPDNVTSSDDQRKQCISAAGRQLMERAGSQLLTLRMCVQRPPEDSATCSFPYIPNAGGGCVCTSGYTKLYDGSCAPTGDYEGVTATAALGTTTKFRPPNLNNKGAPGPLLTSVVAQRYSTGAAVQCAAGNAVACNRLANLCVLMLYDTDSLPCKLHLSLLSDNTPPLHLPRLNYDKALLEDASTVLQGSGSGTVVSFAVSVYDLWGNWKGTRKGLSVFNLCGIADADAAGMLKLGSNRELRCPFDRRLLRDGVGEEGSYEDVAPTDFFELFLVDPANASHLIEVPVVMDYASEDFRPLNVQDSALNRAVASGANASEEVVDGYRRRFYVHDNLSGCGSKSKRGIRGTCYATVLRRAVFVFSMGGSFLHHRLNAPVVVLQYASGAWGANAIMHGLGEKGEGFERGVSVRFITERQEVNRGLMITMIVLCLGCFLSAWIRTYGWMRRRQNMMLTLGASIRFFVYFCNHAGNMFALAVSLASWYIFAVYRSENENLVSVVGDRYVYLEGMLCTATVTKGIAVLYKIVEQCNADYFLIDWERSKGQLLRENRILPVSMWRSTFVANELNELQIIRQWRPLVSMTVVLLFLVPLGYLDCADSIPGVNTSMEAGVYSVTVLRIAVGTFFWFVVCLVLHVVEFQLYYRFIRAHPLQAFVDLCSVSNISIMILPELQWGYYIHGESIHAHADVSMEEFQQNLYLESQGNLPVRGLGGQSKCQTFEVFMGIYMRQYLYMCYAEIEAEHQRSRGSVALSVRPGRRWHFLECVFGISRKLRVYGSETLAVKKRINSSLQQSVRSAEGTLLMKFPLHRLFDMAPNILYMNGPQSGDKSGKDLFFVDSVTSYGNAFLYGIDLDLFVLYMMLYATIDAAMHNVYAAFVITFALEIVIRWYRMSEGLANISAKTLIDDRFFL